jgi:hypothetical protein
MAGIRQLSGELKHKVHKEEGSWLEEVISDISFSKHLTA